MCIRDSRRGVWIDARVPGEQPREERTCRARIRDADARLENAVAVGDPPGSGIERRPVERVRDDPEQLTCRVPRQPCVAVERDAVAHRRQDADVADIGVEAGFGGAAQQAVELLDLAALALPPHPEAFPRVPLAGPVEEDEPAAAGVAVLPVERLD